MKVIDTETIRQILGDLLHSNASIIKRLAKLESKSKQNTKPKSESVIVYRYLRPAIDPENNGITLAIELNYKHRTVRVSGALCRGDAFVKEYGRQIAMRRLRENTHIIVFAMTDSDDDLVSLIAGNIFHEGRHVINFSHSKSRIYHILESAILNSTRNPK